MYLGAIENGYETFIISVQSLYGGLAYLTAIEIFMFSILFLFSPQFIHLLARVYMDPPYNLLTVAVYVYI